MFSEFIRIRKDRIGVLIGEKGSLKRKVEEICDVKLTINDQDVSIEGTGFGLLSAKNFVNAINRGFSPQNAMDLIESEDYVLEIIDVTDYVGGGKDNLQRIKGRVIGRGGSIRARLEELTNTKISVYGKTVSIIGLSTYLFLARKAVIMLLEGNQHKNVVSFLYRVKKQEILDETLNPYQSTEE